MTDALHTIGSFDRDEAESDVATVPTSTPIDFDDLDDLLGEIAGPAPKTTPVDDLDDILSELAEPPAEAGTSDDLDDILSALAEPEPAPVDDLDDILNDLEPAPAAPVEAEKPKGKRGAKAKAAELPEADAAPDAAPDDLAEALDALAPASAEEGEVAAEAAPAKAGLLTKLRKLGGTVTAPLQGTREVSRKGYFGLIGLTVLLASVATGEAVVIVMKPRAAAEHGQHGGLAPVITKVTLVPVDYSKVDLSRYRDKIRSLHEGGRDMLRNAAIKQAVLDLDNGETLYDDLRDLARKSPEADLVDIRENRLTIASCSGPVCTGTKTFKLVYDLQHQTAAVCVSEIYEGGSHLSYSYGPDGYREVPGC